MSISRRRQAVSGFSLLEVLVSLVVIGLVMVALVRAVGLDASALAAERDSTYGAWVAANRVAEVRLQPGLAALGDSSGVARMGGRDWTWRMRVSGTDVVGIRRMSVDVYDAPDALDPIAHLDAFDAAEAP